jgi:inner membrane protein involved in colicin E2 resistance
MTTTTSAAPGRALLFIPGTLFWVLVIAGIVTENSALIGAGVVLLVVTVVLTLARKLRAHAAESDAKQGAVDPRHAGPRPRRPPDGHRRPPQP